MDLLERRVPPVIVTAACAGLMWLVAVLTPALAVEVPARVVLASAFVVLGGVVALAGVVAFRKARTTVNPIRPEAASSLVTSGIYRMSRNPMYLGFLLCLIGWGIALAHPLALLVLPLFVGYMNRFQIRPEERALRTHFGKSFDDYAASTRRWL